MTMARLSTIGVCGVAGLLLLTGCTNPEQLRIEALQSEVNRLLGENDDLRSRLALAISERDQARARAFALEQDVFNLRRQLAEATRPVEEGPWTTAGQFSYVDVGSDFLFDSGKVTLKPAGRERLQQLAGEINSSYGDKMIWVVGNTDAEPIKATKRLYKDNLALSLGRGATVFRELVGLGVPPQRLIAGGQGEFNPIAPNDAQGRSKVNRRVTLFAVPPPPTAGLSAAPGTSAAPPSSADALKVK